MWALFLAGPVLWYTHFWAVYLLAEAVCDTGGSPAQWFGEAALSLVTLAATALAGLATLWCTRRAWQQSRPTTGAGDVAESREDLAFIGTLLGAVFFVAILFVGVPALFLRPC